MNDACEAARIAIESEHYGHAVDILRPLAAAANAEAQFLMGFLFFTSADVSKADSMAWLEQAASQDHPEALYHLACMSDDFDFGPPEDEERASLLIRSAELGCVEAQRDLGCCYATGGAPFPKDDAAGRLWYGRAAEQGHADAQYNYGLMLFYGEGGPAEREAGLSWVYRAADQGDAGAVHFLKNCPDEYS